VVAELGEDRCSFMWSKGGVRSELRGGKRKKKEERTSEGHRIVGVMGQTRILLLVVQDGGRGDGGDKKACCMIKD